MCGIVVVEKIVEAAKFGFDQGLSEDWHQEILPGDVGVLH